MSHFGIEGITLGLPLSELPACKIVVAALGKLFNTLSKIVDDPSKHTNEIVVQNAIHNTVEIEANRQVSRFKDQNKLAAISSPASGNMTICRA